MHAQAIQQLIERMPGRKLPAEREMAVQFGISRTKLRAILAEFETEGLVERHQGSGTYAVDAASTRIETLAILIDKNLKLGDDPFFTYFVEKLQHTLQENRIRAVIERIDPLTKPIVFEDAVITLGLAGANVVKRWQKSDPPLAGMWINDTPRPGARVSLFQLENSDAGKDAARRILMKELCFAYLIGRSSIPDWSDRVAGAQAILESAGVQSEIIDCGMNYAAGLELGHNLRQPANHDKFGIIAANDWLALGLRTGLSDRGDETLARAPIVSFDGLTVASSPRLGIESLTIPVEEIAEDVLVELRRLRRFPSSSGRVVRYRLT